MARQSRSRAAPTRSAPAQTRSATTAAAPSSYGHPPAHAPAPPAQAQGKEPGMMAQMAATAGSVAVGSTIGHGISSMLFGGSSARNPEPADTPLAQQAAAAPSTYASSGITCEGQAKEFTKCLDKADLPSCTWYLEQLKACQAAAAPY